MTRRLLAALLFVLFCASAFALAIARRAQPAYPVSDIAITEIYIRDAAHGRLLVGPYSRFGWHHPGPLLFYLLAPIYVLGGSSTAALHAAAALLSLIVVAAALVTAVYWGARDLAYAVLLAVTILAFRLPSILVSPWNPHIVVVPAIAFLAVAAVCAAGSALAFPIVVAFASFLTQTDLALAPFAAAVTIAALAGGVQRRALVVAFAVAIVLWAPAIAEEGLHTPGNLTEIWRFFTHGEAPIGGVGGIALWSDAITAPFRPAFELAHGTPIGPAIIVPRVVLAIALTVGAATAAGLAVRHQLRVLAWFAGLSAFASVVALWSVSRITGGASDHQTFWIAALGLCDAAAVLVAMTPMRAPPPRLQPIVVTFAVVVSIALVGVSQAADGRFPVTTTAPSAPNFVASIRQYLASHHVRRPLVRIDQDQWWLAAAILLELDRQGVTYAIEDDWRTMFPERFAADGSEDAELTLAAVGQHRDLAARPGNVTIDVSSFIHVEAIPRLGS
jgi:hypothetical protein